MNKALTMKNGLAATLIGGVVCLLLLCSSVVSALASEKVVLQLHWVHGYGFAGVYAAIEKGFYKQAGLEVELREGGPGILPMDECLSGRADLAMGSSEVVLARLRGEPVVALAAIYQHSASSLLTLAKDNILTPQDLVGRRVEMGRLSSDAEPFAMLMAEGVDIDTLQHVDSSFSLDNLLEGRVDAVSVYFTNQPYQLKTQGVEFRLLRPVLYGIDFYGDVLYTTEQFLDASPQVAEDFRKATIEGWYYTLDHPDEIIDLIMRKYPSSLMPKTRDALRYEYEQSAKLIRPSSGKIGQINPGRFQHMATVFTKLGLVPPGQSLEGFVYDPDAPQFSMGQWGKRAIFWAAGILVGLVLLQLRFTHRLKKEVSTRRKTEERLKQSEEQLSLVLWGAGLGYWDWDFRGDLFIDAQTRALLKLEGEQERWTKQEFEQSATAPSVFMAIRQGLEWGHTVIEKEWQVNEDTWVLVRGQVVQQQDGTQPQRISGVVMGISHLKKYQSQLELLAKTDPLTGLPNRRFFFDQVELALEQVKREQGLISIVILDLDRFKRLNDEHGHLVGDKVLVAFASMLKTLLRPYDVVARFGGEEFVVLFRDKDREAAAVIIKRILRQLVSDGVDSTMTHLQVTFSAGIADSTEFAHSGLDTRALVGKADQRLYTAKASGRKLVVWR